MNSLFLLTLLLVVSACGDIVSLERKKSRAFPNTISDSPDILIKQKTSCDKKSFESVPPFFKLNLFFERKIQTQIYDFSSYLDRLYLKDRKVISSTEWGGKVQYLFTEKDRGYVITYKESEELEICPEELEYERGTVESAALNANYIIQQSHMVLSEVVPNIKITPVKVKISPTILVSFSNKKEEKPYYMTDNAMYNSSDSSITFLPHSTHVKKFLSGSYWEIPMIASHEYGHHLFQMIYPQNLQATSCLGNLLPNHFEGSSLTREVSNELILSAYNEGFADLIAYVTLPDKFQDISGVRCLHDTRNISSPSLINGKMKAFNSEAVNSFLSKINDYMPNTCETPSFQDIHVFGAIFAHSADSFLSLLTNSKEEKLRVLVKWVQLLNLEKKNHSSLSPHDYLKETLSLFFRTSVSHFKKSFSSKTCQKISDIYPELDFQECQIMGR